VAEAQIVRTPDGRTLAFCEWGDGDGAPLFFLHGSPGSRFLRSVNGEYERHAIHAVTYDRPGYGQSSRRPRRRVADTAGDIRTIADHLGLADFAVVGVSGGGPHALAAAAKLPGRVTRCATIVSPGPPDADDLDFLAHMSAEEMQDFHADQQGVEPDHDELSRKVHALVDWVQSDSDLPERIKSMLAEAFEAAIAPGPGGLIDDNFALAHPWGFTLSAIRCPVRIMAAEDDVISTTHGRWLADHVPSADLISVPGGHVGPREAHDEELLAWAADPTDGA
jgi:pimeloyl-ACP methyl ester carboxylesterase